MHVWPCACQKRVSDSSELELQELMSCPLGAVSCGRAAIISIFNTHMNPKGEKLLSSMLWEDWNESLKFLDIFLRYTASQLADWKVDSKNFVISLSWTFMLPKIESWAYVSTIPFSIFFSSLCSLTSNLLSNFSKYTSVILILHP